MLKRYHRKGDSGLKVAQARAVMVDVVIENLFFGCARHVYDPARETPL